MSSADNQADDFLYENAPLIEVIAEVRWVLQNVMAPSGVQIDPHFEAFANDFSAACAENGFSFVERVVPEGVPLEFMPYNIVFRYRPRQHQWPCFQIGPGVATVNHVPPYQGWGEFRPHVRTLIDTLLKTYPVAERYLNLQLLELRYIDGFREKHGLTKVARFIRDHLKLHQDFPDDLLKLCAGSLDDVEPSGSYRFPAREPAHSIASIQVGSGRAKDEPAVIATFKVQHHGENDIDLDVDELCGWYDHSHNTVRSMFHAVISDETRDLMGPVRKIDS